MFCLCLCLLFTPLGQRELYFVNPNKCVIDTLAVTYYQRLYFIDQRDTIFVTEGEKRERWRSIVVVRQLRRSYLLVEERKQEVLSSVGASQQGAPPERA